MHVAMLTSPSQIVAVSGPKPESKPQEPQCQICFEEVGLRLPLKKSTTGNGDVLRGEDCEHPICTTCMGKHIASKVRDQCVFSLRCPAVGCKTKLLEHDLRKLVKWGALENSVLNRFVEFRTRDFRARVHSFENEAPAILRMLWEKVRLCPRCNVAIEKSEGCDSFYCICGEHFNYCSAPRAVGGRTKKFNRLIDFAEEQQMQVSDVMKKVGAMGGTRLFCRAMKVKDALGMPIEEVVALFKLAHDGDEDARKMIRAARTG